MDKDLYNKALSQNLKAIRRRKGLTTTDLAKILGVSQAKISYIEHCKGVLSARDVAILSRKLNVPVTEFYSGIESIEDASGRQQLVSQLIRFGATLLAKPAGIEVKEIPFEEVVCQALGFIKDDRIYKGFCTALIAHASTQEINVDRIYALVGHNPFLVLRLREVVTDCIKVLWAANFEKSTVRPRAERQLQRIRQIANELVHVGISSRPTTDEDKASVDSKSQNDKLEELRLFIEDSLRAKK